MLSEISLPVGRKEIRTKTVYVLLLFIAVGAIIRFYKLTGYGLWLDELFSMNGADPSTTIDQVLEYSIGDQPPVFFLVLHGWLKLFGYNDFAGRSLTVIYGLLGIPAIYFLGKEIRDHRLGLFAAFMTTINYFHADFSREIRFYPLVFVLSSLSYLFFLRSLKNAKVVDFIFYALFTSILLNTHYFGMVVFVCQFLIFLIVVVVCRKNVKFILSGLVAGIVTALSIAHWLPHILKDVQTTSFHVAPLKFYFPFQYVGIYFRDPIACAVFGVLFILGAKFLYDSFKARTNLIESIVISGWIIIGFAIPVIYSIVRLPLLTYKYNTINIPVIFIIISLGFFMIPKVKIQQYVIVALIVGALIVFTFSRPLSSPKRTEDWREVAHYFTNNVHNKPTIFGQLAYFHLYYFKIFNWDGELPIDQRFCDFNTIVEKSNEIWLLRHPRYPDAGFTAEQQQLIDSLFRPEGSVVSFQEQTAQRYVRK
jgi:mannosyltransferase